MAHWSAVRFRSPVGRDEAQRSPLEVEVVVVTGARRFGIGLVVVASVLLLGACEAAPPVAIGRIDVSVKLQRAYVYDPAGALLKEIPVSSGADGRTPLGRFRVQSRSSVTSSTGDARVTMRWMTRFNGGIGFHGIPKKGSTPLNTPLGQRAVSHGCVRMSDADANWVFVNVPNGTPVNVIPK